MMNNVTMIHRDQPWFPYGNNLHMLGFPWVFHHWDHVSRRGPHGPHGSRRKAKKATEIDCDDFEKAGDLERLKAVG